MNHKVVFPKLKPIIGNIPQPETELEAKIAEKFGWDNYIFQFPPLIERYYKKEKQYSIDQKKIIRVPVVQHKHAQPTIYDPEKLPPGLTTSQLYEKVKWRYKTLKLPKGFAAKFPYLDKVIRDQITTSVANSYIAEYAEARMTKLNVIVFQLIKIVIDLINVIWAIPGSQDYLRDHPEELQTVSSAAQVTQLFIGEKLNFPQLELAPPLQKNTMKHLKSF